MVAPTVHPSPAGTFEDVTPASSPVTTRRLLAAAVVGAPLLIAVNSVFHPEVDFSGAGFLAAAEAGPGTWFAVHVVAAIGALLGVPAAIGLRSLVRVRGRRLANWGLALTLTASPVLALGFASEASVLRLAARDLDPSAALTLAEAFMRTPEVYAIGIAVMVGTLGALLLGMGLLASRAVPRALAATYLLATAATAAAAPGTLVGPLAFGVIAAVSVAFAARVAGPVADASATPRPDTA